MAESKYDDGYSSEEQEQKQLVLGEEDDEYGDGAGSGEHHTLSLACSIAVKSEVLCVAFSYDGRWASVQAAAVAGLKLGVCVATEAGAPAGCRSTKIIISHSYSARACGVDSLL